MAKTLSSEQWKAMVAKTIADNRNQIGNEEILNQAVNRYAALTHLSVATLQDRDRVVRQAMNDYPQLF